MMPRQFDSTTGTPCSCHVGTFASAPVSRCGAVTAITLTRPVFAWLMAAGEVPEPDAREALNLGVGMVVVVPAAGADDIARRLALAGETVWPLGAVREGPRGVEWDTA